MTAINLDTYSLSLITAKEDILNDRSSTNWAIFTYEKLWNLKLADSGAGGLDDLVKKLNSSLILYGLCRVTDPNTETPRILLIHWVGEHVDETRREICKEHLPAIKYFFKEANMLISARRVEELSQEKVYEVLSKTAQPGRVPRKSFIPGSHQVVGSNYRKTNPAIEMKFSKRESFWERSEREEERRKDEERNRMLDERIAWEKQRVERERSEEEERERLIREKEKLVEEKRKEQARLEAEQRRMEKARWAQQQREYEEEMKGKYRRSQSIEVAAEAAVLVSSRSLHPRDFFRQQERSVSCSFSPPSTPSSPSRFAPGVPHKPAFRYQRSLTESVLSPSPQNPSYVSSTYRRDSDRSPSPAPPKPLSPAFIFSKSALPVSSPKVESLPSFIPPPIVPPRAGSLQYRNISSSTTSPRSYSKEAVTLEESQAMQSLPTGIPLQASPLHLYTPLKPEFEPSKASNVILLNDTYKAELVPIAAQPTEDLVSIHTTKSHVWAEKVDVIPTDNVTKKHISSHICPSPVNVHYITTPETPLNVNQTSGHPDNSREATHVTASPTSRSNMYTLPPNTDSGSPSPTHETSDPRLYSENTQPPAPPTTKDTSPASPATIETMLPLFAATRVDIRSPSPPATEDMPSAPPPAVKPTLSASPLTVVDTPAGTLPSRDATTLPPIRKVLPPQFSSSVEAVPPVAVGTEATIPQFQPSKEEQPTYTSPSTPLPSLLSFVSPSPYIPFRSDSIRHATSRFDRSAAFPSINESPQLNARVSPASDVHQDSKDWYDLQTSKSQDVREKPPTSASLEPFNDVGHELPNISPPNVTRAPPSSDPSSTATETLTTLSTDIMTASPTPGSQTLSMETLTTVSTDIRTTSPTTSSQSLCMDTLTTPSTDIMTTSPTSTSQTVCMDTLTTAPNDTLSTSPTLSSQTLSVDTSPITISQTLAMDTLRHAPTDIISTSPTPSPQTSMCTLTTSSTDILTTSPSSRSKTLSVDTLPTPSTSTITTLPTTSSQTLSVDTLSTAPNDIMITSPTTFAPSIDIVTAPSSDVSTSTSAAPATERPGLEKAPTPVNETPCTSTSNTLDHSEYTTNDHALLSEAPLADISFLSNLSATPGSFTCESSSDDILLSAEEPKITSSQVSQAPPPTENIIPFQAPPTDNSFACKTPETPPTRSSLTCEFPPIENLLPIEISLSTREAPFTDHVPPTETPIICTSLTCETPPTDGCFDAPPPEKSIPHEGSLIDKLLHFDAPPPDNSLLWEEPPIYNIIPTETPPTDRYEAPPTANASPDEAAAAESSCTAPSADTLSLAEAPPITCSVQYHASPIDTILPLQATPTDNMLLFDTTPSGTTITSEAPPTAEILSFESPITNLSIVSEAPPTDIFSLNAQFTDRSIVFEAPPTDHITLLASPYNDIFSSDPPTDDLLMLDSTPFGKTQNHKIGGFKETLSPQTLEPRPEAEIFQIVHTVEMRSETLSDITAHTTEDLLGSVLVVGVATEKLCDSDVLVEPQRDLPPDC